MKRSYSYLLAALALVAGVAIAQQKQTAQTAAPAVPTAAEAVVSAAAAPVAAVFDIQSVQGMDVGMERGRLIAAGICVACHQADGNSIAAAYPKLAGQHEGYLLKQLHDFKAAEAGVDPLRLNSYEGGKKVISQMGAQVAMLSSDPKEFEKDAQSLALWFSSQKLTSLETASSESTLELGQNIYRGGIVAKGVPACAGCHGPTGQGMFNASKLGAGAKAFPLVAGQFSDYMANQLLAFREDARKNSPIMSDIAKRMTDAEINAVTDFMAGKRLTPEAAAEVLKQKTAPAPAAAP